MKLLLKGPLIPPSTLKGNWVFPFALCFTSFLSLQCLWDRVNLGKVLLGKKTSLLEKNKNVPHAALLSPTTFSRQISATIFHLSCFGTPPHGLHIAPYTSALPTGIPSPVSWYISHQLLMLFSLLCCPEHHYVLDFCHAPLPLFTPQVAIPVVSALPLCETPLLLLCTVSVWHWKSFDFQGLYF